MKRFLICALALIAQGCSQTDKVETKNTNIKQPNIIYILADDMGIGDVKAYGFDSKIKTPNLDRLANEGMMLTNMHTNSAVCTPTRYGILTGRYAWRTPMKFGVLHAHQKPIIEPERPTIARFLQQQGYNTAIVGKWHLGLDWKLTDDQPPHQYGENVDIEKPFGNGPLVNGFDYFYGIGASLDMSPYAYVENDKVLYTNIRRMATRKETRQAGLVMSRPGWIDEEFEADQVLTNLTSKSIEWIEQQQTQTPEKPFFLYFPLTAPHNPVIPKKEFKGKSGLSDHGDFVMEIDHHIGRLLTYLDDKGLAENTLIVFTADNGVAPVSSIERNQAQGHFSSGPYRGIKGMIYEGGHRVPFLVRWPNAIKAGLVSDYHGSTVDLYATLSDITGIPLTSEEAPDSISFLPTLKGEHIDDTSRGVVYHSDIGKFAIRQGKWKLLLHDKGGSTWRANPKDKHIPMTDPADIYLFDMETDPYERVNLQAKHPEKVKALGALLASYITQGATREGAISDTFDPEEKWEGDDIVQRYGNKL